MRKLLTIFGCVLLLSGIVCAQFANPLVIQIQNAGTTIETTSSFLRLNCSTNVTCSVSGGAVQITASSTASSAFSGLTPGTNVGTGNFIFSGVGTNLSATAGATITATTMAFSGLTGFPSACTNQAVTGIGLSLTCTTVTSAYVDTSIGKTANPLSQFAATTSAQLAGVLSDEIGSGKSVFATALQGTDANLLTAGTITGTGATLCTDAQGGATTSGCSAGGGSAFQVNTVALSSATTVNFLNSAATNGLTLTFTNTSLGNIQLGFTGTLSNAGLANSATTVNSQACTLGSTCTIPFQTNSTNDTSQTGINHITSTTNAVGLTVTPVNSATNQVKFEITGGTYTGSAATLGTARTLAGNSFNGSANVPFTNAFIVQGTTDAGLTGAQFLGALATGLLKNTTTTGVLSIAASSDVVGLWTGTCSSSTYLRGDGTCQTPAGSGTTNAATQYSATYYSAAGSATTLSGVVAPTVNGQYSVVYNVVAGVAVAPTISLNGLSGRSYTGTGDTVLYSDNVHTIDFQGTAAATEALATATTLGNANFVTRINNWTTGSSTAVTVNATTWTINGSASLVIPQGQSCAIKVDPSGSAWDAECGEAGLIAGTNITFTRSAFGLTIASTAAGPAFQVDATPLTSSATINYQDATAFNGLTIGFSNPSAGNVKLTVAGTLGNAGLTNSSATANGQTCTLGSTCNVNVGATTHGVALNEGNGSAIGGTAVGATGTVLLGQTGADPIYGAVPNAALVNAATTVNGQTCTLGSTCNVNTGGTTHGLALNEGAGVAIGTTAVGGTNTILAGIAASDPAFKSFADLMITDYIAGGGTAQAQTATLAPVATSLSAGLTVRWKPSNANSAAAPTLAVNALTATAITKCGTTALVANDLTTTAIAVATYDGTQFQLLNPQSAGCGAGGGGANALAALAKVASYTILSGDMTTPSAITFTCTAACVATLPSTAPTGGAYVTIQNATQGTAANFSLTVFPNGKNLNGSQTPLIIGPGSSVLIESDGTNYEYLGQGVKGPKYPNSRPWSYYKSACTTGIGLVGPGFFINSVNGSHNAINATSSEPCYYDLATSTSSGTSFEAFNQAGTQQWFFTNNIYKEMRVELPSTATERVWLALTNQQVSTMNASDTPVGPLVGFRYSTVAGDTNWMACVSVNASTAATCTSTGVAVGTTGVVLSFQMADNLATPAVLFYVNGVLTNTITSGIPATAVAAEDISTILTETAAASHLRIANEYIESDKY